MLHTKRVYPDVLIGIGEFHVAIKKHKKSTHENYKLYYHNCSFSGWM